MTDYGYVVVIRRQDKEYPVTRVYTSRKRAFAVLRTSIDMAIQFSDSGVQDVYVREATSNDADFAVDRTEE